MKQSILILLAFLGFACKKEVEPIKTKFYSVSIVPDSVGVKTVEIGEKYIIEFEARQDQYYNYTKVSTIIVDSLSDDGQIKLYKQKNAIFVEYKGYTNELR